MDGEEVSFIQDNARFVLDQIKRDAHAAGHMGCAGRDNVGIVNAVVDDVGGFINIQQGVQGFEGDAGTTGFPDSYKADVNSGTDSILIRYADPSIEYKVKSHNAGSNQFTLWSNETLPQGSTMLITDSTCRSVGLFQVTSSNSSSNLLDHAGDSSRNCTSVLKTDDPAAQDCGSCSGSSCGTLTAKAYFNGATIMPYRAHAYYIGESDILVGMPALKRRALTADSGSASTLVEEIAHGVEDLEITYGLDVDDDNVANRFVDADDVSDWSDVVSIRMVAVFRSASEVYAENQNLTVKLDGTDVALSNDKFLRQVVSTTVRFRNL